MGGSVQCISVFIVLAASNSVAHYIHWITRSVLAVVYFLRIHSVEIGASHPLDSNFGFSAVLVR